MKHPLIYDITKGSFDDGPGIRTVIFFKGCPLNCIWCHNPESISPEYEYFFDPSLCLDCGNHKEGKRCFAMARQDVGRKYSVDELANIILRDKVYFKASSGGVTFSGGEPTLYIDFIESVVKIIKKDDIHITLQTCGYFNYEKFKKQLLPYLDMVLFDIKIIDKHNHKKFTGKDNTLILNNFNKLLEDKVTVIPRTPLINNITATEDNIKAIADLYSKLGITKCEFLGYNPSGLDKWKKLGKKAPENIPKAPLSSVDQDRWVSFYKKTMNH